MKNRTNPSFDEIIQQETSEIEWKQAGLDGSTSLRLNLEPEQNLQHLLLKENGLEEQFFFVGDSNVEIPTFMVKHQIYSRRLPFLKRAAFSFYHQCGILFPSPSNVRNHHSREL